MERREFPDRYSRPVVSVPTATPPSWFLTYRKLLRPRRPDHLSQFGQGFAARMAEIMFHRTEESHSLTTIFPLQRFSVPIRFRALQLFFSDHSLL